MLEHIRFYSTSVRLHRLHEPAGQERGVITKQFWLTENEIMKKYEGRDNDTKRIVITLIEDAMKAGSVRIEPQTGEAQIMVRRCKQADQPNSPAQKSNIEQ